MTKQSRAQCAPLQRAALLATAVSAALLPVPASAQEFTQGFINPSFGGNPFYSDHLLGIANIDRPDEPEEAEEPPLTDDELLIRQIRASLTGSVTTDILTRIRTAQPGETDTFVVGDQRVTFARTGSETRVRVTFVNTRTGETTELIVPLAPTTTPTLPPFGGAGTPVASVERLLTTQRSAPLTSLGGSALPGRALFAAPLGRTSTQASAREGLLLAPPPLQ